MEFHDFAGRATLKEIHTVEQRLTRLGFTHIQFSVRDRSNVLFLGPKLVSPWRLAVLTLIARPLMAAGRAVGRILRDNCGRARGPV